MQIDARAYHCPRWAELPTIPLYLDQLVMVIDGALGAFSAEGEAAVTKTMINNYVKQKIVNPPDGKKYSRGQIARLIQVSLLKRVFSMQELSALLNEAASALGEQPAYDLFCERFEQLLTGAFEPGGFSATATPTPGRAEGMLEIALLALVSKLRLQSELPAAPKLPREKEKAKGKGKPAAEKTSKTEITAKAAKASGEGDGK